jgi:Protein of unknown function (DUF559)
VVEVRTRAELLSELGGRGQLERALVAGRWTRVLRGAYVAAGQPVDLEIRATAVGRLLPPPAVVADRTVLWLCGLDVLSRPDDLVEAVVARGSVVPRRHDVRVREALLLPSDVGRIREVPALRPARATADLMRRLPLATAVVIADAVQHAGLVTGGDVQRELARSRGLRGVCSARSALELSDPRAESPPESRVRLVLRLGGLDPVPQYDVLDAEGRWIARVDLAFPERRVAVEYDGREVHLRDDVFVRDRQRQNALLRAGWLVLRYTAPDLRQPQRVLAEVRSAVLGRAA